MNRYTSVVLAKLMTVLLGSILNAGPVDELALYVKQSGGDDAGMALVLNDETGQLTAALSKDSRLTVQGCTWDAKTVQASRAVLLAAGVVDRASIVLIESEGLPYADSLVNLLVLASWGNRPLDVAELLRVLAPEGIAVIGNDANPSAVVGLEAKLKQAGAKDIKTLSRKGWIQFGKAVNPDLDAWTHNLGGPDLSSVNNDKVAGPWDEVRWIGEPRWGSLYLTYSGRVTGGGIFYYVEARAISTWLVARDAWNGFELWRVPISGTGDAMTCDDRSVYAVDNKILIARDGRTGKKVKDYAPGFVPVGVSSVGGYLLASDMKPITAAMGHAAALDKASGKVIWSRLAKAHPAAEGGVAYVFRTGELEAVEIATGVTLWKTALSTNIAVNGKVYCKAGVVYVQYKSTWNPPAKISAFDARKGNLLWEKQDPGGKAGVLAFSDALWLLEMAKDKGIKNAHALDPRTGEEKRAVRVNGLGKCYPLTGSANYMLYCSSTYLDTRSGVELSQGAVRSPCFFGHVPANGMTYFLPHHCDCGITLRGCLAMAPAGGKKWLSDAATNGAPLLVTTGSAPLAPPADKPDDWPMYRKDTVRSNYMPGQYPDRLKLLWAEQLGNSRLSQAVSAYGLVYSTEPKSHRVFARDAVTGKERWFFIADGRTEYPPALHKGLCLFSTGAGSVYALDALTGKEVWRMRAAPAEKYIAEEGQFASAWPVIGGVMPMNGEIYFSCGRSVNVGGIWLYAVDAATGKIRWRVRGGVSGGDFFLSDGKDLQLTRVYYSLATGQRLAGGKAPSGILRATSYFTFVTLADYMACVEPALTTKKHIDLTDGQIIGENLAFHGNFGVAAWRNRFGTPKAMIKKEWKHNQRFIYAKAEGQNTWVMDDNIRQQMMGVILVGETAYMAGVPLSPNDKSELWVLSGADGKRLQTVTLDGNPVYDGLSAAGGRLYLATEEGRLLCYGAE